jgi:hypothetical protein
MGFRRKTAPRSDCGQLVFLRVRSTRTVRSARAQRFIGVADHHGAVGPSTDFLACLSSADAGATFKKAGFSLLN